MTEAEEAESSLVVVSGCKHGEHATLFCGEVQSTEQVVVDVYLVRLSNDERRYADGRQYAPVGQRVPEQKAIESLDQMQPERG
jgi:hypothetical protein